MPFLVDSIRIALRHKEIAINFILNSGGMFFNRSENHTNKIDKLSI